MNKKLVQNPKAVMASYATLKAMTDSNKYKNQYLILAEFIKYLIVSRSVYSFSIPQMQSWLKEEFNFDLPEAVIKSAIKKIPGCTCQENEFTMMERTSVDSSFNEIRYNAQTESDALARCFNDYAISQNHGNGIWMEEVESEFIKFLLDETDVKSGKHGELIGRFILQSENNETIQKQLQDIREGAVLYCGLCYNIIETGSISADLTLYLDTEVLFDLVGYNGEIYKRAAEDMIVQIRNANRHTHKITLRYFTEVAQEINRFFGSAEEIIAGKRRIMLSTAMTSILNGCKEVSDVIDKQSDFYSMLEQQFHIYEDDHSDEFYTKSNYRFNLESGEYEDEKSQEAIRFISHINVLRKGVVYSDYTRTGHLIVTETRRIQEISDTVKQEYMCGYSLPMSRITDILWFKMGYGFGKHIFPYNASAAIKARMVLAGSIAANVNRIYEQTVEEYKAGKITQDQVTARLLRLQEKQATPESVEADNVDDLLDFSPESIRKYEDAYESQQRIIQERDEMIERLQSDNKRKDVVIDDKDKALLQRDDTIRSKDEELNRYIEADKMKNKRKQFFLMWVRIIWGIIWKLGLFILGVYVLNYIVDKIGIKWSTNARYCIDLIMLVLAIAGFGRKEYQKNKKSIPDDNSSKSI